MDTSSYGAPGVNVGVSGSVIPLSNNIYSLGTTGNKWSELYVGPGSVNIDNVQLSSSVSPFPGTTGKSMIINSNILPDTTNTYTLGASGSSWRDLYVGPGTINIQGPVGATNIATIGSDLQGIVYTEYGFATPFINVGPEIETTQAVGGWQIIGTGYSGPNGFVPTDLFARINGASGPTGPNYSLISNQYGPTGPTGTTVSLKSSSYTGYTGNSIAAGATAAYFLDSANLLVKTSNNQRNFINASFQVYSTTNNGINNLSATIMRNFVGMSGTNLVTPYPTNLANGEIANNSNNDIHFPPDAGNAIHALTTSLWTVSTIKDPNNKYPLNAFTVNMQTIDQVPTINGPTGVFYALRVVTDGNAPIYSNIRLESIQFN
jgi:hypothetical protein